MSPTRVHFDPPAPVGSAKGGAKYPFSMDVEFHDELTPTQREAFTEAVKRWLKVIVGGGPPVLAGSETVAGLLVLAKSENLPDKKGGLLARTDLDVAALRGTAAGPTAHLPGKATITLDSIDMAALDAAEAAAVGSAKMDIRRYRVDLIAHEIGHALGFSPAVWEKKGLLERNLSTRSPVFTGQAAAQAYGAALRTGPTPVPLEVFGDHEEFIGHWRQAIFHSELMTFMLEDPPNEIGPVTVAALQDLGYEVDPAGAQTTEVDFTGTAPVGPPPVKGIAAPALLRDLRWICCRVRVC